MNSSDRPESPLSPLDGPARDMLFADLTARQNILDSLSEAVLLESFDGRILDANKAACDLFGYTLEQFRELTVPDLLPPDYYRRIAHQPGDPFPAARYDERENVRRDGSRFWVEVTTRRIEPDGHPYTLALIRDISDRKKTEQIRTAVYRIAEAAHQAESMDTLYRSIHTIISDLMPAENFYIALYDQPTDTLHFPYFVDQHDPPPLPVRSGRTLTEYVLRTGRPLLAPPPVTETLEAKGEIDLVGAPCVDWLGVPLVTQQRTVGVLVVQSYVEGVRFAQEESDILTFVSTMIAMAIERKQAEAALRDSEERFRSLYENAPIGIYRTSPDGRVLMANPALITMLGFDSFEELAQRNLETSGYAPAYDRRAFREQIEREGQVRGFEAGWLRRDGSVVLIRENATLVRDERGAPLYYEGALEDITAFKQAEAARRRQAEQLEAIRQIGLELTAELDLDALLHSISTRSIELVGGVAGGLYLYRPEMDQLEWTVAVGPWQDEIGVTLARGVGLAGRVWQDQQPMLIDNYQTWPGRAPEYEDMPWGAVLGVPVRYGQEFLGVLEVLGETESAFDVGDVRLLDLLATQAAIAIRNARLYQQTSRHLARAQVLRQVMAAATSTLEFDQVLQQTFSTLATAMQAEFLSFAVLAPSGEQVAFRPPYVGFPTPVDRVVLPLDDSVCGRVLQTGEPMLINDVGQVPFYREEGPGVRSELAVPVRVKGQVIGVLNVESRTLNAFDQDDLTFYTAIAAQLAVALDNAQLYEQEQQRRQEAETLRESALALATALERDEVVERILAQLQQVVPYDTASVQLLHARQLEIVGGRGFPDLPSLLGISFALDGDNPNSIVVRNRSAMILEDAPMHYEEFNREPHAQARIRSWLGVPMLIGDRVVGMLGLDKREPGFYTPAHARLAEAFAAQAAVAIENARLFGIQREARQQAEAHTAEIVARERFLTVLNDITRYALQATDRVDLLQTLADRLAHYYDAVGCYLTIWDEETGTVIPIAAHGDQRDTYRAVQPPTGELTLTESVLRAGRPLLVPDLTQSTAVSPAVAAQFPPTPVLALPLVAGGRHLGAALVAAESLVNQTEDDLARAELIADHIALALAKTQLFQETQQQLKELTTLFHSSAALATLLDTQEVLGSTARGIAQTLGVQRCVISLWEPQQDWVVTLHDHSVDPERWPVEPAGTVYRLTEFPTTRRVLVERKPCPVLVSDAGADPAELAWMKADKVQTLLMVPLVARDRVIGLLELIEAETERVFSPTEIDLCQTLANQAAAALENARLFEETRRRAAHLDSLNAIITASAAATDLDELLQLTLDQLLQALGLNTGVAWIEDRVAVRNLPIATEPDKVEMARALSARIPEANVVADWLNPPSGPSRQVAPFMHELGIRASLTVPIKIEGQPVGCLSLASAHPHSWSPEESSLARAVSRQVGDAARRLNLLQMTRQQAHQVEQIIRTVPEGVLLLGPRGRVVLANPAAQDYLKVLARVGVGDSLDRLGNRPLSDLLARPPEGLWHEITLTQPSPRTFEFVARPVEASRESEGWVLVLRDVTLERSVQQRAQQQDQLAAIGQLAAGIAHDFNNIMAVIVLYTQMLLRVENLPGRMRDRLETIMQQAKRAADLIEQILDFSRSAVLERKMLNLTPFLKEQVKLLSRTLPESIRLQLECDEAEDYIAHADPTRMQQAVMNLALNARDAMPNGGDLTIRLDRLSVRAGRPAPLPEMQAGPWIRIALSDTGVGIPADILTHIFEPFFTTKEPGRGTGLGLSQVYGIVKQHDGHIDVISTPGQGATFSLYLPAVLVGRPDGEPSPPPRLVAGGGETILVVEDNEVTREALVESLGLLNYRVLQAANGRQALEIYQQHQSEIALVLTDLVMPEMSGQDLIRALHEHLPSLRVIVMTGHPMESLPMTHPKDPTVHWLHKPVSLEQLGETVRALLVER